MINFLFDTNKIYVSNFNKIFKFYAEQWNSYIKTFTAPLDKSEIRYMRTHMNILRERIDHLESVYFRTNGG